MQRRSVRLSLLFVSCLTALFLFPTVAFAVTFPVSVDETNFPDQIWREYVNTEIAGGDYELSQSEAEARTVIDIHGKDITDLTGIECFTHLKQLICHNNSLTALNVAGLSNLEELNCANNPQLTTLDVSALSSLKDLYCVNSSLTSLNVQGLSNLEELYCYKNPLTSLNVQGLSSLKTLYCSNNMLTALDVSGLFSLDYLQCYSNSLTSLDVSGLSNLEFINCNDNSIASLNVSGLSSLLSLYCNDNSLNHLDVSGAASLQYLECNNNPLDTLDVSDLSGLWELDCSGTFLASLDVSNLSDLQNLDCSGNSLTSLDVTGLSDLWELDCHGNSLIDLVGQYSSNLIANDQLRAIPMVVNPSGGFMSESIYDFETGNAIGNFGSGVTFGADNRFYAETLPMTSAFETTLSSSSNLVSGVLTFELVSSPVTDPTQITTAGSLAETGDTHSVAFVVVGLLFAGAVFVLFRRRLYS